MTEPASVVLQRCLDRLRAGDPTARGELLAASCARLEHLTRKMLHDYRGVRRWEQTGDVLQNAALRLCRAVEAAVPATARDFYRLAAVQIRRELIDLARHHYGPQGGAAHHASGADADRAGESIEAGHVARWTEFHEQAAALPEEEREVFELLFYQGMPQAEAADVLGVAERTVKRRWQAARLRLHQALGGELPGL